jgi:hypothetical protein
VLKIKNIKRISMKSFPFVLLFCLISFHGNAQIEEYLNFYTATENEGTVLLSWQIQAGNTCNGIQIARSTDNIQYTQIGEIFGICGSIDKPESYSFTDANPIPNATNFYRLQFGGGGVTAVAQIDIYQFNSSGFLLYPNPVYSEGIIRFNNKESALFILRIYDMQGKEIYTSQTQGNYFNLSNQHFQAGPYKFSLTSEGISTPIVGTFIFADF